jgi:hypothetical protein
MEASAASTRWVPLDSLRWRSLPVVLPLPHEVEKRLAADRARLADPKAAPIPRVMAATRVAFAERHRQPLTLSLLAIGPVRILHLPGECMVEFQRFAQTLRPDGLVAVAAYGDLGPGYICTEAAFREGGYEPSASHVAPRSESLLKNAIGQLFQDE